MPSSRPLTFGVLTPLRRPGHYVEVPAGHVLARAGDAGSACYAVVHGVIEARRGSEVVGRSGPGELVGELAPLGGGPRQADLVALDDALVLELPSEELRSAPERAASLPDLLRDAVRHRSAA